MRIGEAVRHALGPLERPISNLYRSYFIDLDDLARTLSHLAPPRSILEIGCGDGFFASRLVRAFPRSSYLGIDITPAPGRLFTGDRGRAEFRSVRLEELKHDDQFDMVAIVDVLHHVPLSERPQLLLGAYNHLAPEGHLVAKDWDRRANLAHALCFASDRFISGEDVSFMEPGALLGSLTDLFPQDRVVIEARVPPQPNNLLVVLEKRTHG